MGGWLVSGKTLFKGLRFFLDGMLVLVFLFIVGNLFNRWLFYKEENLAEYVFEVVFYLVLLRAALSVPWKSVAKIRPKRGLFLAISTVAFVLFLDILINMNLFLAARAVIVTRLLFEERSEKQIAEEVTIYNHYYPRSSFIQEAKNKIPEDAGAVFFGDQRPHMTNYELYPRRIYALPGMQQALNAAVEEHWTWSPLVDPHNPPTDPLNPQFQGYPQNDPSEKIQEDFWEMVESRDIDWVIYYNAMQPEKSWIRRIEK